VYLFLCIYFRTILVLFKIHFFKWFFLCSFHNKFEKHPLAKGFVHAVDALAPAEVRITMNAPDTAHVHSALLTAQAQNTYLHNELNVRASEVSALREHARQLSLQLAQASAKERENAEMVRVLQEHIRFLHANTKR
jgi:hypothetical protein